MPSPMPKPPLPPFPSPTLIETSRRFERWRRARQRGERIPEALWQSALDLARCHGVSKTSQTLRLDYYAVQRRLADCCSDQPGNDAQEFVEVSLPAVTNSTSPSTPQCRLEVRDGDRSTLRLELSGWSASELASFVRAVTGRTR